jgi:hypothetical protein
MPCTPKVFTGIAAWQDLLDAVENYFKLAIQPSLHACVYQTKLPPIFLQRPRHSLTIVGIEKLRNGKRRLLTFDPGYRAPMALMKPHGAVHSKMSARLILWIYRRDETYLKRYRGFESLFLDAVP